MIKENTMHMYIESHFNNYKFKHEVKFFKKKIDFVFLDEKENLHAVELKVKDWKNALYQLDTNQLFAKYCYLGIWHSYSYLVPKKILKKYGIGFISISKSNIEILVKPKKSSIVNEDFSKLIKNEIKKCYR